MSLQKQNWDYLIEPDGNYPYIEPGGGTKGSKLKRSAITLIPFVGPIFNCSILEAPSAQPESLQAPLSRYL